MQERCFYCNRLVVSHTVRKHQVQPPDHRTKDHLVPKARGGSETVVACSACNNDKGGLTVDEYRVVHAYRRNQLTTNYKFPGEE